VWSFNWCPKKRAAERLENPTVEEILREGQLFERKSAMCGLLARLYPEQADDIAPVVRQAG
jgi:hypothetical protein